MAGGLGLRARPAVVVFDALGRERSGTADIGAIEGIAGDPPYPPLTRNDVGPTTGNLPWVVPLNTCFFQIYSDAAPAPEKLDPDFRTAA